MRNEKEEVQYIWHDGVRIREDQLISMAKQAGSYAIAEHYICSLLAHGAMYGLAYMIDKVNEIRSHYKVMSIPVDKVESEGNTRNSSDVARKIYQRLKRDERKLLIRDCLAILIKDYGKLFRSKNHWIGIYLVVKDRVNGSLSMTDFTDYVLKITPACWPEDLRIGQRTLSNYSRCVEYEDRFEAYYDMDNNPWEELCNTFWEILKQQILKEK